MECCVLFDSMHTSRKKPSHIAKGLDSENLIKLSPTSDLVCGAVAGISARMAVAPLDVVKIRFQVQSQTGGLYHYPSMPSALRRIVAHEGVQGLWKGNVPALLMVTPYSALQLAAFYQLKQSRLSGIPEPYQSLSFGAIASALATACTYPLDLLRTRFAAQSEPKLYNGIRHALSVIYQSHGIRGFYAGLQPTLIEIVPYISLHFAFYEGAKEKVLEYQNRTQLMPHESMLLGAASGTASKLLTLPLDNAKKLMQVEAQFPAPGTSRVAYKGIMDVLRSTWQKEGVRGWFRGATPSLVKAAPNSAITFAVYESSKRFSLFSTQT